MTCLIITYTTFNKTKPDSTHPHFTIFQNINNTYARSKMPEHNIVNNVYSFSRVLLSGQHYVQKTINTTHGGGRSATLTAAHTELHVNHT